PLSRSDLVLWPDSEVPTARPVSPLIEIDLPCRRSEWHGSFLIHNRHLDGLASATSRSLVSNLDRPHLVLLCASPGALALPAVQSTLPPWRMAGRRCRPDRETDRERKARARI